MLGFGGVGVLGFRHSGFRVGGLVVGVLARSSSMFVFAGCVFQRFTIVCAASTVG